MKCTDTVIKWQFVNMRVEDKNLPEEHTQIVYYNCGVRDGWVSRNSKGNLCVNIDGKRQDIKTGFMWCYQKDIPVPQEI